MKSKEYCTYEASCVIVDCNVALSATAAVAEESVQLLIVFEEFWC
jgi:O-phosphoseryl-tRNA(Cys) synthetase